MIMVINGNDDENWMMMMMQRTTGHGEIDEDFEKDEDFFLSF